MRSRYAESTEDMYKELIANVRKSDVVVLAGAPSDFAPVRRKGKVHAKGELHLTLRTLPKISDAVKKIRGDVKLILFKAESGVDDDKLRELAVKKLKEARADMILANDVGKKGVGFVSESNEVLLIKADGSCRKIKGRKSEIAKAIFDCL